LLGFSITGLLHPTPAEVLSQPPFSANQLLQNFFKGPLNFAPPCRSKFKTKTDIGSDSQGRSILSSHNLKKQNMKTSMFARQAIYVIAAVAGLLLASCDQKVEPKFTLEEQADNEVVLAEANEAFFYEDVDDVSTQAMESGMSSGKIQADDRLSGAVVTRSGDSESGTLTIDFGAGSTDARGHTRRGSIVVEFAASSREVTFVNFFIGDAKIEGTRKVTVLSKDAEKTVERIDVENGIVTWPDGSVARRRLHRIRERHHNGNILDRLIIYGTEEGNHRNGRGFYIEILESLVFDRECVQGGGLIAVEGKKLIKHGYREITVDYGDGSCDNLVTITNKNGRSWEYRVGG
jgi:hypothetical protein